MYELRTERDALHRVETKHMSQVFEAQQAAFSTERYPTFDARIDRLVRLRTMLEQGSEAIVSAVSQDFGHRSPDESRIAEIAGTIAAIDYAIARVRRWMRPSGRHATIWFLPAGNQVIAQPVGVVGIIAPWNYPVNLAFVPLVSALAAGNRVMIKMSELSPATSEMLADLAGSFLIPVSWPSWAATQRKPRTFPACLLVIFCSLVLQGSAAWSCLQRPKT
jgi:acyl-CoA reductase-like NAD-dependent aldehyde dehydrogenase